MLAVKSNEKIRVAVLYGGRSAEHEVSCRSAANVIQYLDKTKFDIIPIGIDKKGYWLLGDEVFRKSLQDDTVKQLGDNTTWFTPEWLGKPANQQQLSTLLREKNKDNVFDVVFPVVHGVFCEDGTLQGLLELADVPYVGCGVLASAVGMDKDVSKRLATHAGIAVADYLSFKKDAWLAHPNDYEKQILQQIGLPVFVKPANTGSSIGITKVKDKQYLAEAIEEAFRFDTKVLIEKALNVVELEVAVLESLTPNADPIVSVVGEIKPQGMHEFYSYDAKYIDEDGADLIIPAPISDQAKESARETAKKLFRILECESMVRVDLFLNKDNNQIYFNEINTIPGFTKISMYPKLMDASGISYPELLTHLVQLAIKRYQSRHKLIRSYEDKKKNEIA